MALPIDGPGPTYRLIKTPAGPGVALIARDDKSGKVIGEIHFSTMQDAHDCANAIMDTVLDPPPFKAWNVSLHG